MEDVHLGEPTSFLDHVFLRCTQRDCQISNDIVANYRHMFESRISVGAKQKLPSWLYDMEGHAKKCVERYCELANKTTQQLYKVATPCMDDHQFKEEENVSLCSHFGSRAISVHVNIVAVSNHVFHSSLLVSCSLCLHVFALASCLNRALLMHLAHWFLIHPCWFFLRILVLFMGLAPTLMVWAPVPEVPRMRSSMPSFHSLHNSKSRSRIFLLSRFGCPVWIHISRKRLVILRPGLQRSNRTSAPSLYVCAKSRHMLHQH